MTPVGDKVPFPLALVQELWWRLFPPFEVRVTTRAINEYLDTERRYDVAKALVLNAALAAARDVDRVLYTVRIEQVKPDHLALSVIANILAARISSGHYHLWRGNLDS